jgi:sRNA-binding carbon storage regulator CsrA
MALITDVTKREIVNLAIDKVLIKLKVIKKSGKKVRICIDAPKEVTISKEEMTED